MVPFDIWTDILPWAREVPASSHSLVDLKLPSRRSGSGPDTRGRDLRNTDGWHLQLSAPLQTCAFLLLCGTASVVRLCLFWKCWRKTGLVNITLMVGKVREGGDYGPASSAGPKKETSTPILMQKQRKSSI